MVDRGLTMIKKKCHSKNVTLLRANYVYNSNTPNQPMTYNKTSDIYLMSDSETADSLQGQVTPLSTIFILENILKSYLSEMSLKFILVVYIIMFIYIRFLLSFLKQCILVSGYS